MYRGESAMMQREIPISGRESPAAQWRFPDEYDFDTSLIPPSPKHYPHDLDHYLNAAAAACVSPPIESQTEQSIAFASSDWIQMHRDLMDRHQRILSRLGEAAKQAQSLRQENVNLKKANLDLNNRLNLLLSTTPFRGVDFGSGFTARRRWDLLKNQQSISMDELYIKAQKREKEKQRAGIQFFIPQN